MTCGDSAGMIKRHRHVLDIPKTVVTLKAEDGDTTINLLSELYDSKPQILIKMVINKTGDAPDWCSLSNTRIC